MRPPPEMTDATGAGQSWRDRIKVHPGADLFAMMPDDELDALAKDIAENGLQQPIVLWAPIHWEDLPSRGKNSFPKQVYLLDGRNRLEAIERGAANPEERDEAIESALYVSRYGGGPKLLYADTDPYAYVISANLHRRHLTREQKRGLIETLLKEQPEKSDRQIAATVKASPTTVGTVRAALEETGEVSKLDTRTGADGVAQPAAKPKARSKLVFTETDIAEEQKRIVAELAETRKADARAGKLFAADAAPKTTAQTRAQAIIGFSTLLHSELPHTLDALARILRAERAQIAKTIAISHRVVLARGYLSALGIIPNDLRPIGVAADKGAALASPKPPLAAVSIEPTSAKHQPDKRDLSEKIVATLKDAPGLTRTALNARTGAYGYQIEQAIETGMIIERDGALFAGGAT